MQHTEYNQKQTDVNVWRWKTEDFPSKDKRKIRKKKDRRQIVKWDRQKTQDKRQSEADGCKSLKLKTEHFPSKDKRQIQKIKEEKNNRQIVKWDGQKTQDKRQWEADWYKSLKVTHRRFSLQR